MLTSAIRSSLCSHCGYYSSQATSPATAAKFQTTALENLPNKAPHSTKEMKCTVLVKETGEIKVLEKQLPNRCSLVALGKIIKPIADKVDLLTAFDDKGDGWSLKARNYKPSARDEPEGVVLDLKVTYNDEGDLSILEHDMNRERTRLYLRYERKIEGKSESSWDNTAFSNIMM